MMEMLVCIQVDEEKLKASRMTVKEALGTLEPAGIRMACMTGMRKSDYEYAVFAVNRQTKKEDMVGRPMAMPFVAKDRWAEHVKAGFGKLFDEQSAVLKRRVHGEYAGDWEIEERL